MASKNKKVNMSVDPGFFDNVFEPSRKNVERQLGTKVGQVKFTRMLERGGVKLDLKILGVKRNVKKKQ